LTIKLVLLYAYVGYDPADGIDNKEVIQKYKTTARQKLKKVGKGWKRMGRKSLCRCIGTTFGANHWLTLDKCGIICISISHTVLIFAFFEVYYLFISNDLTATLIFSLLYAPSTILALASLFMAWTSNPGAVPMGAKPIFVEQDEEDTQRNDRKKNKKTKRGIRRCRKCNDNFKPARAHHDSVTGRCIVKMDHFW